MVDMREMALELAKESLYENAQALARGGAALSELFGEDSRRTALLRQLLDGTRNALLSDLAALKHLLGEADELEAGFGREAAPSAGRVAVAEVESLLHREPRRLVDAVKAAGIELSMEAEGVDRAFSRRALYAKAGSKTASGNGSASVASVRGTVSNLTPGFFQKIGSEYLTLTPGVQRAVDGYLESLEIGERMGVGERAVE